MEKIASVFILVTAILHCLFFKLESIDFMKVKTLKKFSLTTNQGEIVKIWAFNQGFYNLFLALGLYYSLYLIYFRNIDGGKLLAEYILLFITASGGVLYFSSPKKHLAAMVQGIPAFIGFLLLYFL